MEDTSPEIEISQTEFDQTMVESLAEMLREHKGQNVLTLDLRKFQTWTDYFIIATVTSNTHIDGLERHIKEFCHDNKIEIFGSSRKQTDDQWRLIDLGTAIIHLMTLSAREFYELERLWTIVPGGQQ